MESGVPGFQETSGVLDFPLCHFGLSPTLRPVAPKTGHEKAVTPPEAWGQTGARGLQAAPKACSGLGPPGDLKVPPRGLVASPLLDQPFLESSRLHQW